LPEASSFLSLISLLDWDSVYCRRDGDKPIKGGTLEDDTGR